MYVPDTQESIAKFFAAHQPTNDIVTTSIEPPQYKKVIIEAVPRLPLIENFITEAEETYLLTETSKLPWESIGKRKRMRLGYRHDKEDRKMINYIGELIFREKIIGIELKSRACSFDRYSLKCK